MVYEIVQLVQEFVEERNVKPISLKEEMRAHEADIRTREEERQRRELQCV